MEYFALFCMWVSGFLIGWYFAVKCNKKLIIRGGYWNEEYEKPINDLLKKKRMEG